MILASTVIIMTLFGFQTALVVRAANAGQVVVRIADAAMVLLVSGEMGMVTLLACQAVMALLSQILLILLSPVLSLHQLITAIGSLERPLCTGEIQVAVPVATTIFLKLLFRKDFPWLSAVTCLTKVMVVALALR